MLEVLGIAVFLIGLLASIALHEIGHLVPAKRFGVRVTQYMVGFGPTLWSARIGETEYGVKALPLGGYIRMVGMFPPRNGSTRDRMGRVGTMIEQARADSLAEVVPGQEYRAFYRLSAPRKFAVMFGGPFMNLLLSLALFVLALSVIGQVRPTTTLSGTLACAPTAANPTGIASVDGSCGSGERGPAATAGLRAGDVITAIDGAAIADWYAISPALADREGDTVDIGLLRDGVATSIAVTVGTVVESDGSTRGFIGIAPELATVTTSPSEVPAVMASIAGRALSGIARWPSEVAGLAANLATGEPRDANGPVSIVGVGRISGEVAADTTVSVRARAGTYVGLLASMNLFLFLFNLLPILPLDGGHIAGALYEGARRTVSRLRGRGVTAPADTAKLVPVALVVTMLLLLMSAVVMLADIIKPISLG